MSEQSADPALNPFLEAPTATPGAKMMYLIKRRDSATREDLVAHWFANHMPQVIQSQKDAAVRARPHARRYLATLLAPDANGEHTWDGIAQLWWDQALPQPKRPHGDPPTDSFQEHAQPYLPWATTEYVVVPGEGRLSSKGLTLNAPYPATRSGFFKVCSFVAGNREVLREPADYEAMFEHWLNPHATNVRGALQKAGGFRYVINLSMQPADAPYVGLAELYFSDASGWAQFQKELQPDGLERWLDLSGMLVQSSVTEMIGLP